MAEVARQAEVAVATVFNYFSTKEDLFFFRLEAFEAHLVEAVATRAASETVLAAFRRHRWPPVGCSPRSRPVISRRWSDCAPSTG